VLAAAWLRQAEGSRQTLGNAVHAACMLPGFDNAAMDG
jgi:molybdopterin biosynthesis enzyme